MTSSRSGSRRGNVITLRHTEISLEAAVAGIGRAARAMRERERMLKWLRDHNACQMDYDWEADRCMSLDDCWTKAPPDWLFWAAPRVLSQDELAAFLYSCIRNVRPVIDDPQLLGILELFKRRSNPAWCGGARVTQQDVYKAGRASESIFPFKIPSSEKTAIRKYHAVYAISVVCGSYLRDQNVEGAIHHSAMVTSGDRAFGWAYNRTKNRFANYLRINFKPNWDRRPNART